MLCSKLGYFTVEELNTNFVHLFNRIDSCSLAYQSDAQKIIRQNEFCCWCSCCFERSSVAQLSFCVRFWSVIEKKYFVSIPASLPNTNTKWDINSNLNCEETRLNILIVFHIYVPVWCSGSRGNVDRGITASQEQWDGHFFVGLALFRQVYQRAKSPQLI